MSRLPRFRAALAFLVQSAVVGLAVAFIVVLLRPDLMPDLGRGPAGGPATYADAVDKSGGAVAPKKMPAITIGSSRLSLRCMPASSISPAKATKRASTTKVGPRTCPRTSRARSAARPESNWAAAATTWLIVA